MSRRLALGIWLTVVWVALWGDVSPGTVLAGAALATVLVLAFRFPRSPSAPATIHPLPALAFVAYFVWKLVEASAIVAWEVVTPRNRINEGIIAVPVRGTSDTVDTIVANFITLTPGTLTLDYRLDPPTLYIHVLHLRDLEAVREDVQRLEAMALRAFGSAQARRSLEPGGDARSGGSASLRRRR